MRSPLFYPLNRGMDAEAGGVPDLQTDVMRVMAILALCLVAIFALVQSIPLLPTPVEPTEVEAEAAQPAVAEVEVIEKAPPPSKDSKPLVITRPEPQAPAPPKPAQREPVQPKPEQRQPVQPKPAQPEPVSPPASQGFTLRFETDQALTRLVARNEVGLYAITAEKSLRMNVNRGEFGFWAASVPNQFYEMDETTVPDDVLSALRRAGSVKSSDVKWGVTLPTKMRQQLNGFLSEYEGGSLVIGVDGSLRREP